MTIQEISQIRDVPVVVVDDQGVFTFVNEKFTEIFGFTSDETLGQSLSLIIPGNLHDAHNMGFSRFLTTEKATILEQTLKLKAVNKSGDEFDADHFIIAEKIEEQWQFAATIAPLT